MFSPRDVFQYSRCAIVRLPTMFPALLFNLAVTLWLQEVQSKFKRSAEQSRLWKLVPHSARWEIFSFILLFSWAFQSLNNSLTQDNNNKKVESAKNIPKQRTTFWAQGGVSPIAEDIKAFIGSGLNWGTLKPHTLLFEQIWNWSLWCWPLH